MARLLLERRENDISYEDKHRKGLYATCGTCGYMVGIGHSIAPRVGHIADTCETRLHIPARQRARGRDARIAAVADDHTIHATRGTVVCARQQTATARHRYGDIPTQRHGVATFT